MTPPHLTTPLLSLHVGCVTDLAPNRRSAIHKTPQPGPLRLTHLGLAGDHQADARHHGGPDKALHHYPREHYEAWRGELEAQAPRFIPGGFGENLSTQGLSEAAVCVGDVFRLGSAVIQVSQGRTPCAKLNLRFGVADMVQRVRNLGRTGWYYRVLETGEVAAGDTLTLLQRPCGEWPLARVWDVLQGDAPDPAALAALADLELLAQGWRDKARQRLPESRMQRLQQHIRHLFGN